MTDLVDIARKRPDRITTHWDGCEEQHTECLIARMADEIERLRELVTLREKQLDTHINALFNKDAEIERLRVALEFVLEAARWHFDGDADPKNESPEDMTAHINGLIVQRVREALGDER